MEQRLSRETVEVWVHRLGSPRVSGVCLSRKTIECTLDLIVFLSLSMLIMGCALGDTLLLSLSVSINDRMCLGELCSFESVCLC